MTNRELNAIQNLLEKAPSETSQRIVGLCRRAGNEAETNAEYSAWHALASFINGEHLAGVERQALFALFGLGPRGEKFFDH